MNLLPLKNQNRSLFIAGLVFFMVLVIFPAYSQTPLKQNKKDLENKKKKLNDEINEINSLLNETNASKKSSLNQLVALNKKITIREELINTINAEIHQLNREIKQNQNE